ncbi:MAG: hypothetical protein GXY91_00785 [Clostridia bacterium]|nr:hypothetical protein [Clostridia bacterium]
MLTELAKNHKSFYITKEFISFIIGPAVFFGFMLLSVEQVSFNARGGIGLLIWMLLWWVFRPVHPSVTALLPIIVTALGGFAPLDLVLSKYSSPIVFLLLGANILTLIWQRWGLDKRIALAVLLRVGSNVSKQIVVWFILAAVLSSFIPNTVVAAALIPIAVATLNAVNIKTAEDFSRSEYATGVLLAIAWGSSIGFATPLGGAMNLVVIKYIEDLILHKEVMFITWVIKMLPFFLTICLPILLVILRFPFEFKKLPNGNSFFRKEYEKLGKWTKGEKWGLFLFGTAVLLSFLRPLYEHLLPGLKPPYLFLLIAVLSFAIPIGEEKLITWKYTQPRLMWGMYLLFAGGMALGEVIALSGAADLLISLLTPFATWGNLGILITFSFLAVLLSNIMTITGSMAVIIPLIITTLTQLGVNPLPFVYIVSAVGNVSIMLPSSSGGPAIVAAYGIDLSKMARRGAVAAFLSLVAAVLVGYLFITFLPNYLLHN